MEISFKRFLRSDANLLAAFLTESDWPFHSGGPPSRLQVLTRLEGGLYDGEDVETYWVLHDQQHVGLIRVEDLRDDTPMFDIRLAAASRGRGIGTRTVRWATGNLFSTYGHVRRIEATTRQDNIAMRRVLARCRYVKEAHYRDAWSGADGDFYDAVGYAILRTDWSAGTTTLPEWDDESRLGLR